MSIVLALVRLRQEDCCEFRANLSSIVNFSSIRAPGETLSVWRSHNGVGEMTQCLLPSLRVQSPELT